MNWSFRKVLEALMNIEKYNSYYIGGSLCIDFKFSPSVILNRNGRGFFYFFPSEKAADLQRGQEIHFLMTKQMCDLVECCYQTYKVV